MATPLLYTVHRIVKCSNSTDGSGNRCSLTVFSERELMFTFAICCRPSVCRLSVGNALAPYSGGSNFRQNFYGITYLGFDIHSKFHGDRPRGPLRRGS